MNSVCIVVIGTFRGRARRTRKCNLGRIPIVERATEPGERQLLPRAERRLQLLRAAAAAFARTGFAATSMEDVAREAGVTKLIVYRHFDSKEDLYRAVLHRTSTRLAEEFAAGVRRRDRRGVAVRALLTVAREDPDGFALVWRHAARETPFAAYAADVRRSAVELARTLVDEPLHDSPLRAWAADALVGHLVDAVLHWADGGDPADDDSFVDAVTAGVPALVDAWSRSSGGEQATIRD